MSEQETININGIEYVPAGSYKVIQTKKQTKKQIVVLQRGWIVVGDVEKTETEVLINNCSVIRVWGTSRGLGQIAENGPTSTTKLDPCPPVSAHPLSVVLFMNVNESKW
jgi:hypothetical protein